MSDAKVAYVRIVQPDGDSVRLAVQRTACPGLHTWTLVSPEGNCVSVVIETKLLLGAINTLAVEAIALSKPVSGPSDERHYEKYHKDVT